MSNSIGKNEINDFLIHKYHVNKLSFTDAKKLGIDVERVKDADKDGEKDFDADEIILDDELYTTITAIIEKDKETPESDPEKEKEENNRVQSKNNTKNH